MQSLTKSIARHPPGQALGAGYLSTNVLLLAPITADDGQRARQQRQCTECLAGVDFRGRQAVAAIAVATVVPAVISLSREREIRSEWMVSAVVVSIVRDREIPGP